jgi:hypothetical protein
MEGKKRGSCSHSTAEQMTQNQLALWSATVALAALRRPRQAQVGRVTLRRSRRLRTSWCDELGGRTRDQTVRVARTAAAVNCGAKVSGIFRRNVSSRSDYWLTWHVACRVIAWDGRGDVHPGRPAAHGQPLAPPHWPPHRAPPCPPAGRPLLAHPLRNVTAGAAAAAAPPRRRLRRGACCAASRRA